MNLRSDPNAWIEVGGERLAVRAREAKGEEAERLWAAFTERVPMIASSRELAHAHREAPMFVWEPRSELGDGEHPSP